MTNPSFWATALQGFPGPSPQPEPGLSPGDVPLNDWEENRAGMGIVDNGDFIGVRRWKRPTRYIHHEPTAMEKYAEQRESLGIRDAPQSSVGNLRTNASPSRVV